MKKLHRPQFITLTAASAETVMAVRYGNAAQISVHPQIKITKWHKSAIALWDLFMSFMKITYTQ